MFRTKLRRALASVVLVFAVLLLPVGTAGAATRGGAEREGGRSFRGVIAQLEHLVWSFWASLFEKANGKGDTGAGWNPDGFRTSSDGGH
jgi:hypothetical protein